MHQWHLYLVRTLVLEKGKSEGTLVGSGKTSMLRKHLIGKNIDWTASCVITAAENSSAMRFEKKPVPFGTWVPSCYITFNVLSICSV